MAKRMKSQAIQRVNFDISGPGDKSVSIRKINNGFIVSESGYTGKGDKRKYFTKETFTKTNPVQVNMGGTAGRFTGKK